jgi:hypothetical protein
LSLLARVLNRAGGKVAQGRLWSSFVVRRWAPNQIYLDIYSAVLYFQSQILPIRLTLILSKRWKEFRRNT